SSAAEASWDTMDGNLSSWIGLSGTGWTSRIGQHEGSGMLGLNFSLPPGPSGWAGVQRSSPVNWSAYDRLVLWIEPTAPSLPLSWSVPIENGVASVQAVVNVSGPSGTAINRFSAPSAPGWHRFLADVSSTSSLAGLYNVSVEIRVVADNTSASAVEVRVDDVSILFPNRQNGTYLSGAVPLGATSEFLQVSWTFEAPQPAVVQAKIRSGTDSTPGSTNWGSWRTCTAPGSYAPALAAGSLVQV